MSKFVLVTEAPKKINKGEIVITEPNFMSEIAQNARKAPKVKQTGLNHLREILNSISNKYDKDMDVMRIRLANYEGLPYDDDKDLHNIVVRILEKEYPKAFDKYLDHHIKSRPMGTKIIYYTGSLKSTTPFYENGVDMLDANDIDQHLTNKSKKIVGKPAITSDEAEKLKLQVDNT
jgi:hypothetical protein